MEVFNSQSQYLTGLIFAILGWQLPNLWKITRFIIYDKWRSHPLLGEWHTYHFSRENFKPIFRYETWIIKRAVFGGFKIKTSDPERGGLNYKAKFFFDRGHILALFSGENHQEQWQARLNDPIPGKCILRGVYLGPDFDGQTYASVLIASRTRIDHTEAESILTDVSLFNPDEISLRVKNA